MHAAICLCLPLVLSGCVSAALDMQDGVDRTLITSNIPSERGKVDPAQLSDETTIRNAVSSADIDDLKGKSLAWANAGTGTRGSITELTEYKQASLLCRRFTTTRESFDGIRLFKGEACMVAAGAWRLQAFDAL